MSATQAASPSDGSAGRVARGVVVAAWVVVLVLLLRHREVISSDTLSNYVHVWWVASQLWHGHGLPFHMPVLAHGSALTFPYAFIPWMVAVLLWPLMGEWSVTLVLGLGFASLVAATLWTFPELRHGWWAVAALVNPALVEGLLLGQLPFLWAAAMFVAAIGCWRNNKRTAAIVLAALAQLTHAPVLIPLVALTVACRYRWEPDRPALLRGWLISLAVAVPAAIVALLSPVSGQNSVLYTMWIEVETLTLRALVLAVPFALVEMRRRNWRPNAPAIAAAVLVAGQVATIPISGMTVGWGALVRRPDRTVAEMAGSGNFVPGATYRVLTFGDGKYGPYAVVRAGGRLDSEFFPESLHRRSFPSETSYATFLKRRHVDFVLVDSRYHRFHTNEQDLLDRMTALDGGCVDGVSVRRETRTDEYSLYRVNRFCAPA